jgi:ATP-binding cassette subfamily B multidrug efflux pump
MSKTNNGISPGNDITIPGYLKLFQYPLLYSAGALIIINLLDICLPLIVRHFIDNLTTNPSVSVLQWCLFAYLSTALIQCICRFTWRFLLGNTGARAATLARFQAAKVAFRYPHRVSIGDTITMTHNDADVFSRAFDGGIIISIDAILGILTVPLILFYLNPALAWKVLLPLPFITLLTLYFDGRVRRGAKAVQAANSNMTKIVEGYIADVRMVKANTLERHCIAHFEKASAQLRDNCKRFSILESLYGPGLESFISLGLVSLMVFGAPATNQGQVSLGTFLVFHKFIQHLQWPMRAVALAATTFRRAQVSGERLRAFSVEKNVTPNEKCPYRAEDLDSGEARHPLIFTVGPTKIKLNKGSITALIGPNGSGKSQLLKRLAGLEELKNGEAFCEGRDLSVVGANERASLLSFVTQEPELFALTIRENVLLGGDENTNYTDDDLWRVLQLSAIDEEVRKFPNGLSTLLGEKGTSLSGGQKQRVSLARSLLRNPSILLLDNTLAALDPETEKRVLQNLRGHGFTIMIVTHRLSAISQCDTTVVMQEGIIDLIVNTEELLRQPQGWAKTFIEAQRRFVAAESVGEELLSKQLMENI